MKKKLHNNNFVSGKDT
jgi:hypothetical protein